jgi:hypothetical protein
LAHRGGRRVVTSAPVFTEDYVRERLARAVHALATADGPLPARLFSASLATSTLDARDFVDEESRAEFGAIREMLTRHEASANEGRVRATLARMSDAEARAVAERILELDAHFRPLSSSGAGAVEERPESGRPKWEGQAWRSK